MYTQEAIDTRCLQYNCYHALYRLSGFSPYQRFSFKHGKKSRGNMSVVHKCCAFTVFRRKQLNTYIKPRIQINKLHPMQKVTLRLAHDVY
jgi:hypothetical protein